MDANWPRVVDALQTLAFPHMTVFGWLESVLREHTFIVFFLVYSAAALYFIAACGLQQANGDPRNLGLVFVGLTGLCLAGFAMLLSEKQLFLAITGFWIAAFHSCAKVGTIAAYGCMGLWCAERVCFTLGAAFAILGALTMAPFLAPIVTVGISLAALFFLTVQIEPSTLAEEPTTRTSTMIFCGLGTLSSHHLFDGMGIAEKDPRFWYSLVALDHFPWIFFLGAFIFSLCGRMELRERSGEAIYWAWDALRDIRVPDIQLPRIREWTQRSRIRRRQRSGRRQR